MSRLSLELSNRRRYAVTLAAGLALILLVVGTAWWFFLRPPGSEQQAQAIYPPITASIEPADGATIRSTEAWVSWSPLTQTTGRILWRAAGESAFQSVEASGDPLMARLRPLKAGTKYEYVVESDSGGRTERSPMRTFSVQGGFAFDSDVVERTVSRDYFQPVVLTLHNNSNDKVVVGAKALAQFPDLPADIVGPGSVDEPVELAPGGTLPLNLAVTAPDARHDSYDIPIEAAGAYALARVHIDRTNFKLAFNVLSEDPHSLAKTIEIRNDGDTLGNLAITIAAPNQADVRLQPGVAHGYLPSGQTLEIVAQPVLYMEFQSLRAELEVSANGQTVTYPLDFKAPAGMPLVGVRTDPDERSTSRDWYCTNKPDTCSNVPGPDGTGPSSEPASSGVSMGPVLAMPITAPGETAPASAATGPAATQGACSSCNMGQACKDIAATMQLIDDYTFNGANLYPGAFMKFKEQFDPLLRHLSVNDLACRYDPNSNVPAGADGLLGDMLRQRNSFKTLTSTAFFPGKVPCVKGVDGDMNSPQCQDRKTISNIYSDLEQLASMLGCTQPAAKEPPSGICPEGEEKPDSDTKKALKPIIDALKKAKEMIDEQRQRNPTIEELKEKYEQYKKMLEIWEQIEAASCVPGKIIQDLHAIEQKRADTCTAFAEDNFQWFKKMGMTNDAAHEAFFAAATAACDQALSANP